MSDGRRAAAVAAFIALGIGSVALRAVAPEAATVLLLVAAALALAAGTVDRPLGVALLVVAAALDTGGLLAESGALRFTIYQVMAAGMLAVVLAGMWRARTPVVRTPLDLPVAAFLLACALSIIGAQDRGDGVVQLARLLSSTALAFMVVQAVRSERDVRLLVLTALAMAGVLGVFALAEWTGLFALQEPLPLVAGYGIRARTTFRDPNIFGSFMVTSLLLALPLGLPGARRRWPVWVVGAVIAAAVVVTYSRGSMGALVAGLAASLVLVRLPARVRAGIAVVFVVVVLAVGALAIDPAWIEANIIELGTNYSVMGRVHAARGALEMWRDAPMGVGLGNFPLVYPRYQDPAFPGVIESHVAYLTVLAETGVLGLAAFLWLLWTFFVRVAGTTLRRAEGQTRAMQVGVLSAGVALCAQSFTYSLEASKFLWLVFGLAAALLAISRLTTAPAES